MSVFADALQNVKNMNGEDPKNAFVQKITKTATGSITGLVGGLMFGWYYKKNLYVSAIIGTLAGGAINYHLVEVNK
jgi:uncharacterized membrane protein